MRIGIIGLAGAGKDTLADIISANKNIPKVAFAKPLHDAAIGIWGEQCLLRENKEEEQIFGESVFEWFYSNHIKFELEAVSLFPEIYSIDNFPKTAKIRSIFEDSSGRIVQSISPRRFMQLYGTEYWRNLKHDFFVALLQQSYTDCVIPDVRFENEAAVCDLLINVVRNGIAPVAKHESENMAASMANETESLEPVDMVFGGNVTVPVYTIGNNGTIENLANKVNFL